MNTPPTRESLIEVLEAAKMQTISIKKSLIAGIQSSIKEHKLPYKIENDLLMEVGESTEACLNRFITQDEAMLRLKDNIRKLAKVDDEVLIIGPTGTGKEILAHALHGDRSDRFIGINCAGLPDSLIESELFGHVDGAFTGANKIKIGLLKEVGKGTAFLDEVGELPVHVQGKLLRALQEKVIRKVGSNKDEEINCKIVSATNKPLRDMCEAKTFRLDLYARLSTFELETTALSNRTHDIPLIIKGLPYGSEFISAMEQRSLDKAGTKDYWIKFIDITLNVRSLQQHVKRYKVLNVLPL